MREESKMQGTRTWLLTSTTYGTWLPGDPRGFVGAVWESRSEDDADVNRHTHKHLGTEYDQQIPGLHKASRERMKGHPVYLSLDQAEAVLAQFRETAEYREYCLQVASVMNNHFHIVVEADANILTDAILRDFKSYSSRILNQRWPKETKTWWTRSGSRRDVSKPDACERSMEYVWNQFGWLARWRRDQATTG